jgi:hypothetical protein
LIRTSDDGWKPIPNNSNIHQLGECAVDEEGKFESEALRFINVVPMNFVVNVFLGEETHSFNAEVLNF